MNDKQILILDSVLLGASCDKARIIPLQHEFLKEAESIDIIFEEIIIDSRSEIPHHDEEYDNDGDDEFLCCYMQGSYSEECPSLNYDQLAYERQFDDVA